MRLDRSITLNLIRPLCSIFRRQSTVVGPRSSALRLPILMYHSVSEHDEPLSPYYVTNTRPAVFRNQMQWLKNHGYVGVTLEQGLAWLNSQPSTLNPQPIAITFDDGFQDFYTTAAPILREFGFTATMFVPTGLVDQERGSFKGRPCMTWAEVQSLAAAGIHFGSHTTSHPVLHDLSWSAIEAELAGSKARLEQMLGHGVTAFAYPYAYPQADRQFTARFRELLEGIGYQTCVTTTIGRLGPMPSYFQLPRLPMNSFDDDNLLAAKLAGHYDWLGVPQSLVKRIKHTLRPARKPAPAPASALDARRSTTV